MRNGVCLIDCVVVNYYTRQWCLIIYDLAGVRPSVSIFLALVSISRTYLTRRDHAWILRVKHLAPRNESVSPSSNPSRSSTLRGRLLRAAVLGCQAALRNGQFLGEPKTGVAWLALNAASSSPLSENKSFCTKQYPLSMRPSRFLTTDKKCLKRIHTTTPQY